MTTQELVQLLTMINPRSFQHKIRKHRKKQSADQNQNVVEPVKTASSSWKAFAASMLIFFGAIDTLVCTDLANLEVAADDALLCKVKSWTGKEALSEMREDMVCKGIVVKKTPEFKIQISPLWQIFFNFLGMASCLILYGMFSKSQLPRRTLFAYFVPALCGLPVRRSSFNLTLSSSSSHAFVVQAFYLVIVSSQILPASIHGILRCILNH